MMSLIHAQTDSIACKVISRNANGDSYHEELKKLSHILDCSKISPEITELYCVENKNKPLFLKIESLHVKSFVSLRPLVYSYILRKRFNKASAQSGLQSRHTCKDFPKTPYI